MNKTSLLSLFIFIFLLNCSFDHKTGIWSGGKEEKERMAKLRDLQNQVIETEKIYSSSESYSQEISLSTNINISGAKKISSWKMSGLNNQNSLGNILLPNAENLFLKKKVGKNKFDLSKTVSSPLIFENNIIISDDRGSIYNIDLYGKIKWKQNIYKKLYKKIYKNLVFFIYKENLFVADNIGFIYSISLRDGKLIWIKNHGIPIKSNIKIIDNKLYLINQDNRILCLNTKDGSKIWDIRSIASFIKSQDLLSIAITKEKDIIAINSAGIVYKLNNETGYIQWTLDVSGSILIDATDFFKTSPIVISNNDLIFSTSSLISSYNLNSGEFNWQKEVNSAGAPIIDGKYIFFVSENGYSIILNKNDGKIISSKNILNILKKKKRETKISGFIMGSGKIYSVTENGYLVVSAASSGEIESFKKLGDPVKSNPIIVNEKLYILTENSRILGFN